MASAPKQLETKWTEGPWAVECGTCLIWGPAPDRDTRNWGAPVADAHLEQSRHNRRQISAQEQEANARLIAAAPEMAELLGRAEGYLAFEGDKQARELYHDIRDLLRKIGGDV